MTEVLRRGIPGMKSVKDMPVVQDMPPPGGFPAIRFGRRIANTGPSGALLFGASALVMGFGFYKSAEGGAEGGPRNARAVASGGGGQAVLSSEWNSPEAYVEYMETTNKAEASIMGKTPNWKVNENVYNNGKWYPPVCSTLPGSTPFS